jgi:arylsulfatase A-like enzyme
MDGRSLAGFWEGREDEPRVALLESDVKMMEENTHRPYHGVVGKLRALRDGRFKLVLTPEKEGPEFELYDVVADPEESNNLALDESYHETLSTLQEQLMSLIPKDERRAIAEIRGEPGSIDRAAPVDEHERKLLESLGYVNR